MPIWPLFIILNFAAWLYISLWFAFGQYLKRHDVLDSAWGLGFAYLALISLLTFANFEPIPLIATGLVCLWGIRLFAHITSRNIKKAEDSRYAEYRRKWQKNFALNAYLRLYLPQALLMLVICSSAIAVITAESFYEPVAYIGLAIWLFGIVFESIADAQLRTFLSSKPAKGSIMDRGLWRYSRHPNYFGEITVWTGAAIVALSASVWWGVIGAITITFLITKVSGIPLLEKRYANDKNYQKYAKATSVLIPLPPRR